MTLESIYYIGQTVAVLAILASLVAIYFQLRQSQAIERATAQRELLKQSRELSMTQTIDEAYFNDICQCLQEYTNAKRFVKGRFHGFAFNWLFICEQVFYQNQNGLMNAVSFDAFMRSYLSLLRTPGGAQWWQSVAYRIVGRDISDYLNKRLAEDGDTIPPIDEILTFMRVPDIAPIAGGETDK